MARFPESGETGRGRSPLVRLTWAAIAVGLIASVALVGYERRGEDSRSVDRDVIPNHYLVVVQREDVEAGFVDPQKLNRAIGYANAVADRVDASPEGYVSDRYRSALVGFSAVMSPKLALQVEGLPRVEVIRSKRMQLAATAERPPFGLDRSGQRMLPLDRFYGTNLTGKGVHVYVVDSGILSSNPQFANTLGGTRVGAGRDFIVDGKEDCEGHGTHVAGTIGAIKYGIAKNVILHPIRVAGCGKVVDSDNVIKGLDWIVANATAPAIVNISLSGSDHPGIDAAVQRGINSGFIFTVAAGNVDDGHPDPNACKASPAKVPAAITVGAMDPGKDMIAPFSFRGGCVDLFAPGVNILSARNDSNNYGALMDGTSMAAAHAAGVAALYLEACMSKNIKTSPRDVWRALNFTAGIPGRASWKGLVKHPWGSPNKLLHWQPVVQPGAGWTSPFDWLLGKPKCLKS